MNKNVIKIVFTIFISTLLIGHTHEKSTAQTERFNMSYIYFGSPVTYVRQVDATKGSLNVVSPNYFDINAEGRLDITWRLQSTFITEMHNRGIKVVPFLSNHWDASKGIKGLENRQQLAKEVADAVAKYNLDGVNVDIEGVGRSSQTRSYRDEHTDFIRLLREYIPNHKEVSVAVAANPNGWQTGWHGFYDYKGLSQYADYLMIMAYDESWESPSSPIGPVSSLSFTERSILYAINQGVPKEKIVNGLPFYGRMWKLDGPAVNEETGETKNITGMGVSSTRVAPLVNQFQGQINFDEKTQSPYATFTIPEGKHAIIGTTTLTKGNYVIWFENERSIKAKLRLVAKYDIKGTGSWALLHETPDTWEYYSRWLNGKYFVDVPSGHWGESSIISASNRGWITGTTSTTFSPHAELTRAQGAVILVRALGYESAVPQEYKFTDTKNHWARREIEIARELGMINGIDVNSFGPNQPLTREQLSTILFNIFDYEIPSVDENPFPDISKGRWSYEPILATYQKGYISGFKDGTFRPFEASTRVQMAALMDRMQADFEALRKK